jgi:hypothetical protein
MAFIARFLRLSLLAGLAPAGIACGPSSPSTAAVQLQAPTPPTPEALAARKTPEEALQAKEGQGCDAMTKPRDAAFCYLKSEAEASIEPLFALGRTLADKAVANPVSYWPDFTYAAENAGILAAKTHDARLYAGLGSASEADQLFAVHALRHMLGMLRWGHIHGKSADEPVRKDRLPAVHAACLDKLAAQSPRMVNAAADCLKEIHDPADAGALLDVAAGHPSIEVQIHVLDVAGGAGPLPKASLAKLAPLLEKPLAVKWTQDEVSLRAAICRILLREVDAKESWAKKAAETAVREIGNRNSQARQPCEALAKRAP